MRSAVVSTNMHYAPAGKAIAAGCGTMRQQQWLQWIHATQLSNGAAHCMRSAVAGTNMYMRRAAHSLHGLASAGAATSATSAASLYQPSMGRLSIHACSFSCAAGIPHRFVCCQKLAMYLFAQLFCPCCKCKTPCRSIGDCWTDWQSNIPHHPFISALAAPSSVLLM